MFFLPEKYQWHLKQIFLLFILGGATVLWLYQPKVLAVVVVAALAISLFRMLWHWFLFLVGLMVVAVLFSFNHLFGYIGRVVLVVLSNVLHPFFTVARAVEKVV